MIMLGISLERLAENDKFLRVGPARRGFLLNHTQNCSGTLLPAKRRAYEPCRSFSRKLGNEGVPDAKNRRELLD